MNISFDFYEYAGIIVPGSVLAFGAMFLMPEFREQLGPDGFTFGELGLFVVLSYALGQLVQGIGNAVEWLLWWPLGGLPNKRVLDGEALTEQQHLRLLDLLRNEKIIGEEGLSKQDARAAMREVYARVAAAGQSARVDKFNGIYGMLRGLSASLLLLTIAFALVETERATLLLVGFSTLVSLRRMHRFGWHYGRELVVVYLAMHARPTKP
ncbi:hypothetical protein C8N32_101360 [Rhodovulum imhoffii]|uniref:Uncharacterized protein n=1 Tax=Rhodovulum imhoffii TaxID=365340 RepID=A0A2T5BWY0_9RHOB|nr:hypothetical protein [Rhodovulum imhoffii]MBK5933397.1 hypothetical protein [Rhodovulum imhoffii]PTN04161.1 hypothetical protein C8N32_101360 [Rhodovulum imhoffii]